MASTFTPNIQWEEPARGDQVGVWDTPVNNNGTLIDLVTGAITTIGLNNSNVVLSAAQFRSAGITFNSTLIGSVTITFPTSFTKGYKIRNTCTGSSAFVITLGTTAAGGQVICCPPGESIDAVNDGTNLYFHNLERVGSYWDYGGSSVPAWVSNCTVPPYLNCNGGAFSSATYPQLAVIMGGTTLPDTRNRARYTLAQGAVRISSGLSGFDGTVLFAAGGTEALQVHTHGVVDPGHAHGVSGGTVAGTAGFISQSGGGAAVVGPGTAITINSAVTGISISNAGIGGSQNMPPAYIGGITMIRAG